MRALAQLATVSALAALAACSTMEKPEKPEEKAQAASTRPGADSQADAAVSSIKIELNDGKVILKVKRRGEGTWSCSRDGAELAVKANGGEYTLTKGSETIASGTLDGGTLKLEDGAGKAYMDLKFTTEKVKISLKGDATVWELKRKENKYKVRVGETEYGKVKYYPDNGKTKAKDTADAVVAQCKSFEQLNPSLGAFLVKDANEEMQTFLMLVLMSYSA